MRSMTDPAVSVIVPCYNEEMTIRGLLEAIHQQTFPSSQIEVIISDGMSTDGTRAAVKSFSEAHPELNIRLIDNYDRNIPAALNRAIAASRGAYIVRLDAHSIPHPTYVETALQTLETTGAANVGGVWEIHPGGTGWIARSIATAAANPLGAGGARYRVGGTEGEVDTVPFGAFQRFWLERTGRFDESLLTNEDYEFNVRIRAAGGSVWFNPEIRSIYLARPTLGELARQYWRYGFWKVRMLKRFPRSLRIRQALPPLFVLSLISALALSPFFTSARFWLIAQVGIYLLFLVYTGVVEGIRRKDYPLFVGVPLALITMHLAWGTAFLWSWLRPEEGDGRGTG